MLPKKIGERASIGCPGDPAEPCDVDFAINSITPNVPCVDEYGAPIGANEQMLRFDIEVWTAQQFANPDVDTAFFLDNWGVGGAEGVATSPEIHTAIRCQGELTGDQIQKLLVPGQHFTKNIYITAPRDASVLRLYMSTDGDGWMWSIP